MIDMKKVIAVVWLWALTIYCSWYLTTHSFWAGWFRASILFAVTAVLFDLLFIKRNRR